MTLIDLNTTKEAIQKLLSKNSWLQEDEEIIDISIPGEGNMNVVLRLTTNQRTFVLKQSRDYVQKYQDIPASASRIDVEFQFYNCTNPDNLKSYLPSIVGYDKENYLLMMEDLGNVQDMSNIYGSRQIEQADISTLVSIASEIHNVEVPQDFPENRVLRELNHQHIFVLPFVENNDFNLDDIQEGLKELSLIYKKDIRLKETITKLGEKYLQAGTVLIHGDYYPGSWMKVDDNIYVIDPEFSFVGDSTFDIGVMCAHLYMATSDTAICDQVSKMYPNAIDIGLVYRFAGVEVMRRLIGLAQLPLERTIEEKEAMLAQAKEWIID